MTTPTETIKFSDIVAEFGSPTSNKFGNYRVNQNIAGKNWPLDSGVPVSGQIKFSDLKGKTLNVVVDYNNPVTEYSISADIKYSNGIVVGGFKSLPPISGTQTKIVYNVIRQTIGGTKSPQTVALKTGSTWNNNTKQLNFIVTSTGKIVGSGGDGGNGAGIGSNGSVGKPGYSAFGASFPCNILIEPAGLLQCGYGGGGGGGYSWCNPDDNPQDPFAGAGGGGGGAGLPAGNGGIAGINGVGAGIVATAGLQGTLTSGGSGGSGGSSAGTQFPRDCASAGAGGGGSGPTVGIGGLGGQARCPALNGSNGNTVGGGSGSTGSNCGYPGGNLAGLSGGLNGFGVISNVGVVVTVTNNGTYYGGLGSGTFN